MLIDVEVSDEYLEQLSRPSKKDIAEDIASRLMLNELGYADCYMLKEVNGKLIKYGELF